MLRDEILEVLDLFNKFNIPEESQRKLFESGLYFDFTYGDYDRYERNQHLNIFGIGILLKKCLEYDIEVDINKLLSQPYSFHDESLIKEVALAQNRSKAKRNPLFKTESVEESNNTLLEYNRCREILKNDLFDLGDNDSHMVLKR